MSARETINHKQMKQKMKIHQCLKYFGGLAIGFTIASHAWAAGVINAITSGIQSGEVIIKVELSEPLTQELEGFVIQSPARIAIDLPNVTNGLDRSLIELSQGNLRSVAIAQAQDRTRLILNLGTVTNYSTQMDGNTLLIRLVEPQINTTAAEEQTFFSPTTAGNISAVAVAAIVANTDLQNIDFRTSVDGAGALIITLPSDQTPVNVRQQGSDIIVDVLQTTLPPSLRRILDVSDYRTPMRNITAEQIGENVRLTIKPVGQWEQSAFQAQNQFVLELHPVKDEGLTPGSGYRGELLSLNFQDVDVRTLLQVIANFTDFNVVTSDSVQGNLTLRLQDVPWDQALEIIMQAKGLAADRNGNVLWIAPRDEIRQMQQERIESMHESETMEPLRTQVFQLNYAQAQVIMDALTGADSDIKSTQLLSDRGSIIMDSRTNKLIVTDIPSRLERFASVIMQIDIPVRQVMIEARIVEATDGWGRNLGVRMSGLLGRSDSNFRAGGTLPRADDSSSNNEDDDENQYSNKQDLFNFFDLSANSIGSQQPGYFAFHFARSFGRYLQLELQALESENYGRNIASPRLMTADGVTARVEQGVQIPYLQASSSGATAIEYKTAALVLEVTPRITPNGSVELNILITQDSPAQDTRAGPMINTNRVNTQVVVENGGTVVIGGIFNQKERVTESKIPFLGDIPLVGHFFRNSNRSNERSELLMFITPRIVDDGLERGSTMPITNLSS